jgi:hypothetical protein
MNTRLLLLAQYETTLIPVERIAGEWFGISYEQARARIKADREAGRGPNRFPLEAFQLGDSQKAPWFVRVEDAAAYIDAKATEARTLRAEAKALVEQSL